MPWNFILCNVISPPLLPGLGSIPLRCGWRAGTGIMLWVHLMSAPSASSSSSSSLSSLFLSLSISFLCMHIPCLRIEPRKHWSSASVLGANFSPYSRLSSTVLILQKHWCSAFSFRFLFFYPCSSFSSIHLVLPEVCLPSRNKLHSPPLPQDSWHWQQMNKHIVSISYVHSHHFTLALFGHPRAYPSQLAFVPSPLATSCCTCLKFSDVV